MTEQGSVSETVDGTISNNIKKYILPKLKFKLNNKKFNIITIRLTYKSIGVLKYRQVIVAS